jgi:raffinose/stachyose/melibiose transport system permease protein
LPTLLSVVIIGFIWQLILSPLWGVGEKLMGFAGLADFFAPWLGEEESALTAISMVSVWQYIGMPMMLIYAALLAVPDEVSKPPTWKAPVPCVSSGRSSCR